MLAFFKVLLTSNWNIIKFPIFFESLPEFLTLAMLAHECFPLQQVNHIHLLYLFTVYLKPFFHSSGGYFHQLGGPSSLKMTN